jgi:hypothetical protein
MILNLSYNRALEISVKDVSTGAYVLVQKIDMNPGTILFMSALASGVLNPFDSYHLKSPLFKDGPVATPLFHGPVATEESTFVLFVDFERTNETSFIFPYLNANFWKHTSVEKDEVRQEFDLVKQTITEEELASHNTNNSFRRALGLKGCKWERTLDVNNTF